MISSTSPPNDPEQDARDRQFRKGLIRGGQRLDGIQWIFELDDDPDLPLTATERKKDARQAASIKGLLWHASIVMIDELFADLETLAKGDEPADTWVLSQLPPRFRADYDILFTRKFLVAAVEVTARLTSGWTQLASTAQELAFGLLLLRTEGARELFNVDLDPHWADLLTDCLMEDVDFMFLYDKEPVVSLTPPAQWFLPFNPGRHSAPYAEERFPS